MGQRNDFETDGLEYGHKTPRYNRVADKRLKTACLELNEQIGTATALRVASIQYVNRTGAPIIRE